MVKFLISRERGREYRFTLYSNDGERILISRIYKSKLGCLNGIKSVRENAGDAGCYLLLKSRSDRHYFVLKAANWHIVGTSEFYETKEECLNRVNFVKLNASAAVNDDQSYRKRIAL